MAENETVEEPITDSSAVMADSEVADSNQSSAGETAAEPSEPDTSTATPPVVHVSGVTLDKTNVTVDQGGTITFSQSVAPSDATDQSGKWSTSDTSKATVSGGTVNVKSDATGEFDVAFTANDGGVAGSSHVTINEPGPVSYTVQPGDDIAIVATNHGVSVGWLKYINHISGLTLPVGRVIYFN